MEIQDDAGHDARALVLAAGRGLRFGEAGASKVLHTIRGVPLIAFTLDLLRPEADELAVAVPTGFAGVFADALEAYGPKARLVEVDRGIGVVPTIATAVQKLGWAGPMIVAAGDELYAPECPEPGRLLSPKLRSAFIAKGVYRNYHTRPPASACYVEVDDDAVITAIGDEPRPDCWRGTGLTYLSPQAVETLVAARDTHSGFCAWIRSELAHGAVVRALELKDSVNLNTRDDISDADSHVLGFSLLDRFPHLVPATRTPNPVPAPRTPTGLSRPTIERRA